MATYPERDLAHERDMEMLRKEQLRGEEFSDSELMGDPDECFEYFEHYSLDDDDTPFSLFDEGDAGSA